MVPEMRAPFNFVETLIILLLVDPAPSIRLLCNGRKKLQQLEASKYVRTAINVWRQRLDNIAICHVHKDVLNKLNVNDLMNIYDSSLHCD